MTDLMNLDFEGKDVRVIMREGEPWWVVNDVCAVLGITNTRNAVARLSGEDIRLTDVLSSQKTTQQTSVINESGLYELIFRSEKPAAKEFRRWVTREVLPQIRRTGGYVAIKMKPDLQRIYDLVMVQARHEAEIERLALESEHNKQQIAAAAQQVAGVSVRVESVEERVLDLETTSALSDTADLLTLRDLAHACGTGQNRMKQWLMAHGVMFRDHNNADRIKQHPWVEQNLAKDFWEKWANGQGWSWVPYFSARGAARIKRMYEQNSTSLV